jgi:transketolase
MYQRDAFIERIKENLKFDKSIYFLSADFGAPALDDLRKDYPDNFIHCGISEQAMIDVAVGLALEGKKVFCYAMAPFLSMRALEQIKCGPGIMNLPICLISVGVGIGYCDSGPTHYVTEEYACLRSIVGSNIYTASDAITANNIAKRLLDYPEFSYVRLDRDELPDIYDERDTHTGQVRDVFVHNPREKDFKLLISHGKMAHVCKQISDSSSNFAFADILKSKPFPVDIELTEQITKCDGIVVVDEQTPSGALSSAVWEWTSKNGLFPKIKSVTLPETYVFENGGREYLLNKNDLSKENIILQSQRF